jgi:hypothetical protein
MLSARVFTSNLGGQRRVTLIRKSSRFTAISGCASQDSSHWMAINSSRTGTGTRFSIFQSIDNHFASDKRGFRRRDLELASELLK